MTKRGFRFEFDVPDDWEQSKSGNQFVFHGPQEEELIVSGALLQGEGTEAQVAAAREQLIKNALQAVSNAAAHPDLVTIKDLRKDDNASGSDLDCWTIASQTKAGDVQFLQAALSNGWGVLLATFEAPSLPEATDFFRNFLRSVRNAPTD